jgi:hypothetical protein
MRASFFFDFGGNLNIDLQRRALPNTTLGNAREVSHVFSQVVKSSKLNPLSLS